MGMQHMPSADAVNGKPMPMGAAEPPWGGPAAIRGSPGRPHADTAGHQPLKPADAV